jgi:hypothetical protein
MDAGGFREFLSHGMPEDLARRRRRRAELPVQPASSTVLVEEGDEIEAGGRRSSSFSLPGTRTATSRCSTARAAACSGET